MVYDPAKYVYALQSPLRRNSAQQVDIHKRTHGASTIASFLTTSLKLVVSKSQESKRGKRLSM